MASASPTSTWASGAPGLAAWSRRARCSASAPRPRPSRARISAIWAGAEPGWRAASRRRTSISWSASGFVERRQRRRARRRRPGEVARRQRLVAELRIGLADDAQGIGIGVGPVGERAQGADRRGGVAALPLGRAEQPPGLEIAGLELELGASAAGSPDGRCRSRARSSRRAASPPGGRRRRRRCDGRGFAPAHSRGRARRASPADNRPGDGWTRRRGSAECRRACRGSGRDRRASRRARSGRRGWKDRCRGRGRTRGLRRRGRIGSG